MAPVKPRFRIATISLPCWRCDAPAVRRYVAPSPSGSMRKLNVPIQVVPMVPTVNGLYSTLASHINQGIRRKGIRRKVRNQDDRGVADRCSPINGGVVSDSAHHAAEFRQVLTPGHVSRQAWPHHRVSDQRLKSRARDGGESWTNRRGDRVAKRVAATVSTGPTGRARGTAMHRK